MIKDYQGLLGAYKHAIRCISGKSCCVSFHTSDGHGAPSLRCFTQSMTPLFRSCTLQTRRWTNYFKVIENGESLWNVHRALNVAAFLISIVAMIIALSTKEFAKVNFLLI